MRWLKGLGVGLAAVAAVLGVAFFAYRFWPRTSPPGQPDLLTLASVAPIQAAFNEQIGEERLLVLLSPTCPKCVAGASGLGELLAKAAATKMPTLVVWMPVISSDIAMAGSEGGATSRGAAGKPLLVFFSRAGENYFNGGRKMLEVGNTEVVAGMIRQALGCDVFQIRPVDPYSDRYDPTVQRNVREQSQNARPGIVNLPSSVAAYDTLLIGSPIWNVRVPRIVLTFAEHFDFAGKTIHPFTTHAMSGLGHAVAEYTAACRGAIIGEALAIRGEQAESSRPEVEAWLRRISS